MRHNRIIVYAFVVVLGIASGCVIVMTILQRNTADVRIIPHVDYGVLDTSTWSFTGEQLDGALQNLHEALWRRMGGLDKGQYARPFMSQVGQDRYLRGGGVEITYDLNKKRISQIIDTELFSAREKGTGDYRTEINMEYYGDAGTAIGDRIAEILQMKFGLNLGQNARLCRVQHRFYKGVSCYTAYWRSLYHGYEHMDDVIYATVEDRDGEFMFIYLDLSGTGKSPAIPVIDIPIRDAIEKATSGTQEFYGNNKLGELLIKSITAHGICYVYKNSIEMLAPSPALLRENQKTYQSCLSYRIELSGVVKQEAAEYHEKMEIYVSCEDGTVVGAELIERERLR